MSKGKGKGWTCLHAMKLHELLHRGMRSYLGEVGGGDFFWAPENNADQILDAPGFQTKH